MTAPQTNEKDSISKLKEIDEYFREHPDIEKSSQYAERYIVRRREEIKRLLCQNYPNTAPFLYEKMLGVLQKSHFKRDYSTELIIEYIKNKNCHSKIETLLKVLSNSSTSTDAILKELEQYSQQSLSTLETVVRETDLEKISFNQLVSLWKKIIVLQKTLSDLKTRFDDEYKDLELKLSASKQDVEKFTEGYIYGEAFSRLVDPLYDSRSIENKKAQFVVAEERVKALREQLQEILDFVSARTSSNIQKETTLLNILFLMAAVAGVIALIPFGWYAMVVPIILSPFIYLVIRYLHHKNR